MAPGSYRLIAIGSLLLLVACGDADTPAPDQGPATAAPSEAVGPGASAGSPGVMPAPDGPDAASAGGQPGGAGGVTAGVPGTATPPSTGAATQDVAADLPTPVPSSEANAILVRAERAYSQVRSMEADFSQEVYVPLLETTQSSRGRLFHRSPDRFLMRFSDPQGDVIVADGRYVWMYYPSTDDKQVIRAPLSSTGQQVDLYREFLADATSRFAASLDASESVGGRPAKALTLIPRQASPYRRVRIWVDDQDSLVRRFEISEENGSVRRLQLSGLRMNGTLSDDLFRFTPPAGVQVHDF